MDEFIDRSKWVSPWLIQRLRKTSNATGVLAELGSCLSFGGGIVRGGFSKEAWAFLRTIFEFDYMGSSEFEWGAVPAAFKAMIDLAPQMVSFSIPVEKRLYLSSTPEPGTSHRISVDYVYNGNRRRRVEHKIPVPAAGEMADIWVICRQTHVEEAKAFILSDLNQEVRLKECTMIRNAIDPIRKFDGEACGWIELHNPFMFFTDKNMYDRLWEIVQGAKAKKV